MRSYTVTKMAFRPSYTGGSDSHYRGYAHSAYSAPRTQKQDLD